MSFQHFSYLFSLGGNGFDYLSLHFEFSLRLNSNYVHKPHIKNTQCQNVFSC